MRETNQKSAARLAAAPTATGAVDPHSYRFLQEYVYRESGIVLDKNKTYLLEARLMPIVQERRLGSISDLCALLRATRDAELRQRVVDAMTTNETFFFRDTHHWESLREHVIPGLADARSGFRRLRFWSAAASTGQEAYSLAMLLLEMGLSDWDIRILGTDLSSEALEKAREGKYGQIEINRGLPASYLVKYFRRSGLKWELKPEVKRMVEFRSFDLRRPMRALGPFDLVLCKNVLIYFDAPTKKAVLEEMRGTLYRGGYLLLGASETAGVQIQGFQRVTLGNTTYFRAV